MLCLMVVTDVKFNAEKYKNNDDGQPVCDSYHMVVLSRWSNF